VASLALKITEVEERELRRRAGQYTRPYREVIRAKIVLLAAEGLSDVEIAARLDCSDRMVAKWRRRFAEEGLAGLDERPRPGRPRSFSPRRDRRGQGAGVRAAGDHRPATVALVGR
jgi:transposase-like protein